VRNPKNELKSGVIDIVYKAIMAFTNTGGMTMLIGISNFDEVMQLRRPFRHTLIIAPCTVGSRGGIFKNGR